MNQNELYGAITVSSVALLIAVAALVCAIIASRPRRHLVIIASAVLVVAEIILLLVPLPPLLDGVGFALALLGVAIAVVGGGPAVVAVLDLATRGSVPDGDHGGIMVGAKAGAGAGANESPAEATGTGRDEKPLEVLRGGATIGYLERVAVAASLLAGYPEGLAVVVAIKGVGRFTELSEPETRERFIIGTFASLVWASAGAAIALLAR
ncbi:hypothetical protein ALI44B_00110 [Leifsonia sp. ALI-44-B]|jgi:hypothetical protein|uniref:hypothetical protein n=1 Tax=Leifsonia sp. ALI-44-B TaxID=1933776 RepID=UPI00097C912B|nr:hypothetical protein [Leifsonia sp. ALI-44-B]ONI65443.1 hypothetical protein ALI44B_00110 [Leifsonia sp. ALI-44-B]